MKIIRKQYGDNGELKSKCVIRENATLMDFKALQGRAMNKAEWRTHGTPSITNWAKRCIVHTKTGQSFEFLLIN